LTFAVITRRDWVRCVLIAFAIGIKLYGVLVVAPFALKKQWKIAAGIGIALLISMLPFFPLIAPFYRTILLRGSYFWGNQNISPAMLLLEAVKKLSLGEAYIKAMKILYAFLWTGTFLFSISKRYSEKMEDGILSCLPWMAAFPMQVFPYTGVLLLPTLAWKINQLDRCADTKSGSNRIYSRADVIFLLGFTLVGTQVHALQKCFQWINHSPVIFHAINPVGMALVLIGLSLDKRRMEAQQAD
jgi:hypothetical protein